jgi:HlyD family secretion protein
MPGYHSEKPYPDKAMVSFFLANSGHKRQRVVSVLSILLCLYAAGCSRPKAPAADDAGADDHKGDVAIEVADAKTGPAEWTLEAPGLVVAAQGDSAHTASAAAGRILKVLVREGDHVTAGQVVALIESRPQNAALESARAAASSAEALSSEAALAANAAASDQANAVRIAELALQTARQDREAAVAAARNQVLASETDLRKARNGNRPQEIAQADLAVSQAKATRDRADAELKRTHRLLDAGVAPKRQLEDAQTAFDIAEAAFQSAKAQSTLMHAGTRPEDIQAAQVRLDGAREALKQAALSGDAHINQAEAALKQAKDTALAVSAKQKDALAQAQAARQKRADLAGAAAAFSFTEVRAPISGTVAKRALNPGDMADTTTSILDIAGTGSADFMANVAVQDAARIRAGMQAHVLLKDAGIPEPITGTVSFVGQSDPASGLVPVRIQLSGATVKPRIGAYGTAAVVLKSLSSAIVVPRAAVVSRDGKSVVYVIGEDSTAHQREITLGQETGSGDTVAVEDGLKAGEKVAVQGAYELADGSKVKVPEEKKPEDGKDADKSSGAKEKPDSGNKKGAGEGGK